MFARASVLSLILSSAVLGLDLDVNSADSIKAAAKTFTKGIVAKYDADLKAFGPPGLFDKYYWWEAGTVWNALIGYSRLTGDSQYDARISEALQWQIGNPQAFMPPNQTTSVGNDDQSCWGLAALTAAEVGLQKPKDVEWVQLAANVFNTQVARIEPSNATCGGGLRWQISSFSTGYNYL